MLQAHKAYLEGTEHRTTAFKNLLKNDAEAAKVIEQRMKKLVKLQVRGQRLLLLCCCCLAKSGSAF